jgi:hypothetical protein
MTIDDNASVDPIYICSRPDPYLQAEIQAGAPPLKKDWCDWTDNRLMLNT